MGVRRRGSRGQQGVAKTGYAALATSVPTRTNGKSSRATENKQIAFGAVMLAIESLYNDELKPFGRILRRRITEFDALTSGCADSGEVHLHPEVDVAEVLATCEASDSLRVEPEEGGDWSVIIVGRPETFVDIYSPLESYPADMWAAASAYFQALGVDDMTLPGGRYSCAQALQARDLDFFHGRSLGQLCHIVQIAISKKKLLGYLNGGVVPYQHSQSMVKEQCAQLNAPCAHAGIAPTGAAGAAKPSGNLVITHWEVARRCLRDILDSASAGPDTLGAVPLSNIKRLFRSRFQAELSETTFGHSKISELLQDDRFSDICSVQLKGHGYIVVRAEAPMKQQIMLADTLPLGVDRTLSSKPPLKEAIASTDASPSADVPQLGCRLNLPILANVQRTFIHAALPPPTPLPNARQRSASLPKDIGSSLELVPQRTARTDTTMDTARTHNSGMGDASERATSSDDSESCGSDQFPVMLEEPVKLLLRECSLQGDISSMDGGAPRSRLLFCPGEALGLDDAGEQERPLLFCPDEPLSFEKAGFCLEPALCTQTPGTPYGRAFVFCPNEPLDLENAGNKLEPAFCTQTPMSPVTLGELLGRERNGLRFDQMQTGACTHTPSPCWPSLSHSLLAHEDCVGSKATPSVYGEYTHHDTSSNFGPCPAFVPPSPALTASPTWWPTYRELRQFRSFSNSKDAQGSLPLSSSQTGIPERLPSPLSLLIPDSHASVIRLADLLR